MPSIQLWERLRLGAGLSLGCGQDYPPETALRIGIDPGVRVALGDDAEGHRQGRGPPGGPAAGAGGISSGQADGAAGPVRVAQQRPGGVAVLDGGGDDPVTPGHPGRAAAGISVQLC